MLSLQQSLDYAGLVQRAGLALPVADSGVRTVLYRDAWHLMADLRSMGEGNALQARQRRFTKRAVIAGAAARYAQAYAQADGKVRATFEIIFLTGWAPHADQQKPLRPGSAVQRLADALNARETPLPRDPGGG